MDRFRMLPSYHYEDNTDGVLLKSVGKPLRDYKIEGNCFQDGIPSPENPIEVQCCGEKTVNMIDYTKIPSRTASGITFTNNNNGTITANGTLTGVTPSYTLKDGLDFNSFVVGEIYYASCGVDYDDGVRRYYLMVQIQNSQTGAMRYYASNGPNATFSLTENECVLNVDVRINSPTGELFEVSEVVFSPIICKASEYVDFEPYGYKVPVTVSNDSGEKTYNIYLNEPLRKVGDYADYIDFKKSKVVRNCVERVFDGTENWIATSDYVCYLSYPVINSNKYCLSTHLLNESNAKSGDLYFRPVTGVLRVYEKNSVNNWNRDLFVNMLVERYNDGVPVVGYFAMSVPTETLIDLPKIFTEKGTNIISVGTTLQPSTVNYQYYKGGK